MGGDAMALVSAGISVILKDTGRPRSIGACDDSRRFDSSVKKGPAPVC
jgi:hypothetical protein